jgi:coenzyme PQQ synthesis protein D (PqqD)
MTDDRFVAGSVRLTDSVRLRIGPKQGFLFDERSGHVYSLSASSALAAARLRDGSSVDEVIRAVVAAFDVDETTARRDVAAFVEELIREGLATVADGHRDEPAARRRR